ncbi:MAG TPA: pilus assembly protein TadG-related protein [Abditibacteriaceae bacterium]|jgi:hypothetical protein
MKQNLHLKKNSRRKGSVIVTVALGTVMLFGFTAMAVDFGRSVIKKNQLQRACDAGALAGVQYLPNDPVNARVAARYYAFLAGVNVPPGQIQIAADNSRITVPAKFDVAYLFAPVMRMISGKVEAQAIAAVQQRTRFTPPQVVPIGITPSTYNAYKDGRGVMITGIRQNVDDLGLGGFVLFDLREGNQAKSPAHMQDQLQWGSTFNEIITINKQVQTLNAAMPSEIKHMGDGLQTRLDAANRAPYFDNGTRFTDIPAGSPRVMHFIVTPEQPAINGNNNAPVKGFVPVYVEAFSVAEVDGKRQMRLQIRFLPLTAGGGGVYEDVDFSNTHAETLRVYRLVS